MVFQRIWKTKLRNLMLTHYILWIVKRPNFLYSSCTIMYDYVCIPINRIDFQKFMP